MIIYSLTKTKSQYSPFLIPLHISSRCNLDKPQSYSDNNTQSYICPTSLYASILQHNRNWKENQQLQKLAKIADKLSDIERRLHHIDFSYKINILNIWTFTKTCKCEQIRCKMKRRSCFSSENLSVICDMLWFSSCQRGFSWFFQIMLVFASNFFNAMMVYHYDWVTSIATAVHFSSRQHVAAMEPSLLLPFRWSCSRSRWS